MYMYAFLRETHRLTPAILTHTCRQIASDIEMHGVNRSTGSTVEFMPFPIQMDQDYIHDPYTFNLTNFLLNAIKQRKNTYRELIDHPYFKEPFSQVSRKCPEKSCCNE